MNRSRVRGPHPALGPMLRLRPQGGELKQRQPGPAAIPPGGVPPAPGACACACPALVPSTQLAELLRPRWCPCQGTKERYTNRPERFVVGETEGDTRAVYRRPPWSASIRSATPRRHTATHQRGGVRRVRRGCGSCKRRPTRSGAASRPRSGRPCARCVVERRHRQARVERPAVAAGTAPLPSPGRTVPTPLAELCASADGTSSYGNSTGGGRRRSFGPHRSGSDWSTSERFWAGPVRTNGRHVEPPVEFPHTILRLALANSSADDVHH